METNNGQEFCHTLHIMDSRGESVVVNKKCSDRVECSAQNVGCLDIDSQKVCVSCCDENYCNEAVPTNHSTAVFSNSRTRALDARKRPAAAATPAAARASRAGGQAEGGAAWLALRLLAPLLALALAAEAAGTGGRRPEAGEGPRPVPRAGPPPAAAPGRRASAAAEGADARL
ncbi:hypothetical protein R5R35_013125 [Gryllus longicercus]|uniref:Uncharacterized protein n=1 Tax=Gryllus longicercus TaxID=2509291 RepID=A0AAN9WAI1_9ORTH